MSKKTFLFFFILFTKFSFGHTSERFWVFFKDKNLSLLTSPLALSPEKLNELKKSGRLPDEDDYPVSESYVHQIRHIEGINIRHKSRWLNAVSVEAGTETVKKLTELSFVKAIVPFSCPITEPVTEVSDDFSKVSGRVELIDAQKEMKIPYLNKKKCKGKGVKIAVFDDGFKFVRNDNSSYQSEWFHKMKIGGTYDFAEKKTDVFTSGIHGTHVSSFIAGRKGSQKGAAFKAVFYLARTEVTSYERNSEEDNWVAAAEWADSIGVNLIHTSLNYTIFDAGEKKQYEPDKVNGKTAVISLAAQKAFNKGIIVVSSAGNEGEKGKTSIGPPCDAEGTICVGAIEYPDKKVCSFSSIGPTADGRIKPDVVSFGSNVHAFGHRIGDGTSYAAPQVAAMVGCVLGKFKNLNAVQIRQALISSCSSVPNNSTGYGLPDGEKFHKELVKISEK